MTARADEQQQKIMRTGKYNANERHILKLTFTFLQRPGGSRLEYILASRSEGGSTTAHVVRLRAGRNVHAVAVYESETDLREKLLSFDWIGNAKPEGDAKLLEARKRQLALFSLEDWPGDEQFRSTPLAPSVAGHLGRVVLICGAGLSLRDDRIHVRRHLREMLLVPSDADEPGAQPWVGMAIKEVVVYLPNELLETGLELVDAPGTADACPLKFAATCEAVRAAGAVVAVVGAELTAPVLDVLENSGDLAGLLLHGAGWRPLALVHNCGESTSNLSSNEDLRGRQGKQALLSLQTSAAKSLGKLRTRMRVIFDRLSPEEQESLGNKEAAVDRAVTAVREVSCLPLLWASNMAHPAGDTTVAEQAKGAELLQLLVDIREDLACAKDAGAADEPVAALLKELEAAAALRHGGAEGRVLPEEMAALYAGFKRRADPAVVQEILLQLDKKVYAPLQSACEDAAKACSCFGVTARLNLVSELKSLEAAIDARRATVLVNAFQRDLRGCYGRFALRSVVFRPLTLPASILAAVQTALQSLAAGFFDSLRDLLLGLVSHLFSGGGGGNGGGSGGGGEMSGGRVLRGDKEAFPGREVAEAAVDAFLSEGGAGRQMLQAAFELCFGKVGGSTGPFGRNGMRKLLDAACSESLATHLLGPAQAALRSARGESGSGGGDCSSVDVKKVLKGLLREKLQAVYKGVDTALAESIRLELRSRAERLHRRLGVARVRKGCQLVVVHLVQCCLDSAAGTLDREPGQPVGLAAEQIRHVASRVKELAREARWPPESRAAGIEELVSRWQRRLRAESAEWIGAELAEQDMRQG